MELVFGMTCYRYLQPFHLVNLIAYKPKVNIPTVHTDT